MDGTATIGTSTNFAREGHIHPTDTSRAATSYVDSQDALKVAKAGDIMTGTLTIKPGSGYSVIYLDKPASGQGSGLIGRTNGTARWEVDLGNGAAESGSNAGSDFVIARFNDAGSLIDSPLTINRANGQATFAQTLICADLYACRSTTSGVVFFGSSGGQSLYYDGAGTWTLTGGTAFIISASSASKPGGGPWAATSDARVKNVISDYNRGLTEIESLGRPVLYSYLGNDTPRPPASNTVPYPESPHHQVATDGTRFVGLLAQECGAMPEMVNRCAGYIDGKAVDDLLTLDTTPLVFALVNAVKELSARVVALEQRIKE
jgi:hypothetical protein